jgi:hypothetical protein
MVAGRLLEGEVDFVTVCVESAVEADKDAPEGARAAADGRIIGCGVVAFEKGMFDEECEIECDHGGVDEIDEEDLRGGGEAEILFGGHRFFPDPALGFGV